MPSIIQQIADELNVSNASVSRALNDRPGVGESLRSAILERARELNYTASVIARGLATSQTFSLGFFVREKPGLSAQSDPFYGDILRGVEQISAQTDYHVSIGTLSDAIMSQPQSFRFVREGRVDGMILAGPDIPSDFILAMLQTEIPVVLVDNRLEHSNVDCINSDDENGAYLAARHLLEKGHHRVGIISGPMSWPSNARRVRGYWRALANGSDGVPIIHKEQTTIESGKQAFHQLIAAHPDITAICAVNDSMAIGAIRAARIDNGLHVPDDLAVVGFDDIAWAELNDPPLTTVSVPKLQMGIEAANRLLKLLADRESAPVEVTVGVKLIPRASSGARP
jgi:DNA-binding LacI/PurR family transcriptional regulator